LCLRYHLTHPLALLNCPPRKEGFKKEVKLRITDYWLHKLRDETSSLRTASRIWLSAKNNPFETSKVVIVARIISGRYRSEAFCRHWTNSNGNCLSPTCRNVLGDVEHLLLQCPALDCARTKMFKMWQEKTAALYPDLFNLISKIRKSAHSCLMHFLLNPCSFPEIIAMGQAQGTELLDHACYLTRTYVHFLHKEKQKIISKVQSGIIINQ